MTDEPTIKAALEKEARQMDLPPDLLGRIQRQAEAGARPGRWARFPLGARLEVAAAVALLALMLGLAGYQAWSVTQPSTVGETPPAPVVPEGPEPGPAPSTDCTLAPQADAGVAGQVSLFFTCSGDPFPSQPRAVARSLLDGADPLQFALEELLKGPTGNEQAKGFASFFSAQSAGTLRSVTVTPEGRAIVNFADFRAVLSNASSTAGANLFLQELGRTIFQFPEIKEAEYLVEGSCDAFWEWLQSSCQVVPADPYQARVPESGAARQTRRLERGEG